MKMNNKLYDALKYITLIVLPALLTFYGVVGKTLSIPHTQEVLIIGSAFVTFLGTCLGISSYNYNKTLKEGNNE